jgi:hypothetical protein
MRRRIFGGETVTTSALDSTHDDAAPAAALEIATVQEPPNRPIKRATAVSVLLHASILLALGVSSLESTGFSTVPELQLTLHLDDGRDTEHDNAPAVEHPVPQTAPMRGELAGAVANRQASDIEPLPAVVATPPPPASEEKADEPTPQEAAAPSESPSPEDSAVLATTGESDREAPVSLEAASQEQNEAISTPERTMLARRVIEWAQGIQAKDLTQARLSWQDEGRQFTAVLNRRPAADNTGIERLIVEIATAEKGKRLRTEIQMKRLAFSHFTQLVDHWDTEVQFHDDEISGRFHSNSQIFVGYDRKVAPRFLGKVTTAARGFSIGTSSGRIPRNEIFPAGLETRARRIVLPAKFLPFATDQGVKYADVQSFASDTRITFYSDGSYGWRTIGSNAPEQLHAATERQAYIAGGANTSLYIRGTIKGTVLVYSPESIVIEGNLVYARDPRLAADASDYLGLVSDNSIEIARPTVTGPGNLEIDAAIYARRRFVVTHEEAQESATLLIYGSLTAGTLSATEPRYATNVRFDPRFEQLRPPGFPMTNRYEIETWDQQWKPDDEAAPEEPTAPTQQP